MERALLGEPFRSCGMTTKKDYFPAGNEDIQKAYLWATIFALVIATSLILASREYVVLFDNQIKLSIFGN
jgi:hypothetical protein